MRFDPERGEFDAEAEKALKAAGLNDAGIERLRDGGRVYIAAKRRGLTPKDERDRYKEGLERKKSFFAFLADEQRRGFDWPRPYLEVLRGEREITTRLAAWNRRTRLSKSRTDPDLLDLHTAICDAWRIAGHDLAVSAPSPTSAGDDDGGPSVRALRLAVGLIAGDELVPTVSGGKAIIRRARDHVEVQIVRREDGRADLEIGPRHVISRLLKKRLK